MERKLDQSLGGKFQVDDRGPYLVDSKTGGKFRPVDIWMSRLVTVNDTILQERKAAREFRPVGSDRIYSPILSYETRAQKLG